MIKDKIKSPAALKKILLRLKRKKKRVAFTNGCFDILHYGHARYLEDAKRIADILVVAVNTDGSVRRLKGDRRPIIRLLDRMRMVAALGSADYVTYFDEDTPARIISYLKPGLIIKGSDYSPRDIVGKNIVESYGGRAVTVRYLKGYSVTSLIDSIVRRCKKQKQPLKPLTGGGR